MESLYRKYRPLTFDSVVGQQHIVSTLEHAVGEGRLSHAYLFCGPRGTGKTTMARILAKSLLCERSEAARASGASGCMPDGTCPECEAIAEGNHPDVYELDAASRTGVDNVREEIINSVSFAPVRGAYKVYIIDEVHMLTTAAFNALLKTLEEPPSHVIFVLCTTDPQKLLDTILSRCQRFDFHRISNEDLVGRMRHICEREGFDYDDEALDIVARHARGGMRDALSTLEQLSVFGGGSVRAADARALLGEVSTAILAEFSTAIARRDVVGVFGLIRAQADGGGDLMELTRDLVSHMRDVYTACVAGARPELFDCTPDEVAALGEEAAMFEGADRLARVLTVLDDAALEMRAASDVRLVLEIACTRLARPESDLTLEALAERLDRIEAQLAAGVASAPMDAASLVSRSSASVGPSAPASPVDRRTPVPSAGARPASHVSAAPWDAGASAPSHVDQVPPAEPALSSPRVEAPAREAVSAGRAAAPESPIPASRPVPAGSPEVPARGPVPSPVPATSATSSAPSPVPATPAAPSIPSAASAASSSPAPVVDAPTAPSVPSSAPVASPVPSAASATPAAPSVPSVASDAGDLQRRWADVVKRVTRAQASRGALLQSSRAQSDDGSTLVVGLPAGSGFAIKMLARADSQALILPIVAEVFGPRSLDFTMGGSPAPQAPRPSAGSPARTSESAMPAVSPVASASAAAPSPSTAASAPALAARPSAQQHSAAVAPSTSDRPAGHRSAPRSSGAPAAPGAVADPVGAPDGPFASDGPVADSVGASAVPAAPDGPVNSSDQAPSSRTVPSPQRSASPAQPSQGDETPPWVPDPADRSEVDHESGPTIVAEPDVDAQRRAWEDEQVPYDDATIASCEEYLDAPPIDLPDPSDQPSPASAPAPEASAGSGSPASAGAAPWSSRPVAVDEVPQTQEEAREMLDNIFGAGVVFKAGD
ncbi:MAG: DNA polymerase III subunit gamma/tau [Collinsella sp.]|nr:DNA polymerase III subunit gamma/tau [Collinsella sp.]